MEEIDLEKLDTSMLAYIYIHIGQLKKFHKIIYFYT